MFSLVRFTNGGQRGAGGGEPPQSIKFLLLFFMVSMAITYLTHIVPLWLCMKSNLPPLHATISTVPRAKRPDATLKFFEEFAAKCENLSVAQDRFALGTVLLHVVPHVMGSPHSSRRSRANLTPVAERLSQVCYCRFNGFQI